MIKCNLSSLNFTENTDYILKINAKIVSTLDVKWVQLVSTPWKWHVRINMMEMCIYFYLSINVSNKAKLQRAVKSWGSPWY